ILGGGRAHDPLQLAHQPAHRLRRTVGEVVDERRIGAGVLLPQQALQHGPLDLAVGLRDLCDQAPGQPRRDALLQTGERVRRSRWVFPRPLLPTSTSGLYFLPGCLSTARAAPTATSLDGPTAYAASGNAADVPGGGAAPSRTLVATSSASPSRSGSRNTLCPAA